MAGWLGSGSFSNSGSPDFIAMEKRHPSAEDQGHVAARFVDGEVELTPKEPEQHLHPSLRRRFTQFWGWR
jgi:hypothetical protein